MISWFDMVRRNAFRALGLALMMMGAPALAQSPGPGEPQAIRVAVEGAYPPFNFVDQNGELQGFEVNLLAALCEAMKARCTPVLHQWDGIVRGLINREYDAIMSSLEITERRKRRIAFSRRYYLVPPVIVAGKGTELSRDLAGALAGRRVGAVDGSEHAAYVRAVHPGAELVTYAKLEEANLDLLTERLDAVVGDKLAMTKFLGTPEGDCCRIAADIPPEPAHFGQGYGVGVRQEDEALRLAFDRAIEQVMADGTYDRIRARYFPFDIR
jgi:polar amino acid transport system substrate-binding protein